MENDFAHWEILLVRKQMAKLSPVEIASMLGKGLPAIEAIIKELTGGNPTGFEAKQIKGSNKKLNKKAARENKDKRDRVPIRTPRKVKIVEKTFETRKVNSGELMAVKVDTKTTIYVRKGTDIEAVKAKYKARDPTFLKPEKPDVPVKKFKKVK